MLTDAAVRTFFDELFPIRGKLFSVELDASEGVSFRGDEVMVGLLLIVRDEDGGIRDVKTQTVCLLGARQRTPHGLEALRALARSIARMDAPALETLMPHDLFPTALLALGLDEAALNRVLNDARARRIVDVAPQDLELLATVDPGVRRAPPCLTSAEHETQLLEHPDDAARWAVYADWLTERGDPRGELMSVQLELETCLEPAQAALRARERHLLHTFAWEWLGEFAWAPENEFGATWRRGFLRTLRLGASRDSGLEPSFNRGDQLRELWKLRGLSLLERLEVYPGHREAEALARTGVPPSVTRLAVLAEQYELGDLEPVWAKLAAVRELLLDGRSMSFGQVELPALTSFEVVSRGFTRDNLASLRSAEWPRLERLVLCVGETGVDGCDLELADLEWIFDAENLPHVVHLGLANADAHQLAQRLLSSRILPRLRTLDLSRGELDDAGARFLREHHHAFAHLERLTLPRGWRNQSAEALRDLGPHIQLDDRFIPVSE